MFLPKTIRAKLTLTTAVVTGAVLTLLGLAVDAGARQVLFASIDANLTRRGDEAVKGHANAMRMHKEGEMPRMPFKPPPSEPFRTLRPRFFRVKTELPLPDDGSAPFSPAALALSKSGKEILTTVSYEDQPVRVFSRPLYEGKIVAAVVQIPYDLNETVKALEGLRSMLLLMIPFAVAVSVLGSFVLIDRLMGPLRRITHRAEAIGASTLAERLPIEGNDEFAYLGSTLNKMLDRLQTAFEVEQATTKSLEENLKQQKRFSADASHELKTPLAVIKANAGVVRLDPTTESQEEGLTAINEAVSRMNTLIQGLLTLSKAESSSRTQSFEPVLMSEVIAQAVREGGNGNSVLVDVKDPSFTVYGSFEDLSRMISNLVQNAVQHSEGTQITVTLSSGLVEVKDNGKGIAPQHLPQLFDRFYRVDESRSTATGGTGLGLAIVKSIATAHGGSVAVESELGKGAVFKVSLPRLP